MLYFLNLFSEDCCFKVEKQMVYPKKQYINKQEGSKHRQRGGLKTVFSWAWKLILLFPQSRMICRASMLALLSHHRHKWWFRNEDQSSFSSNCACLSPFPSISLIFYVCHPSNPPSSAFPPPFVSFQGFKLARSPIYIASVSFLFESNNAYMHHSRQINT